MTLHNYIVHPRLQKRRVWRRSRRSRTVHSFWWHKVILNTSFVHQVEKKKLNLKLCSHCTSRSVWRKLRFCAIKGQLPSYSSSSRIHRFVFRNLQRKEVVYSRLINAPVIDLYPRISVIVENPILTALSPCFLLVWLIIRGSFSLF